MNRQLLENILLYDCGCKLIAWVIIKPPHQQNRFVVFNCCFVIILCWETRQSQNPKHPENSLNEKSKKKWTENSLLHNKRQR